jgi:hypothetical protein
VEQIRAALLNTVDPKLAGLCASGGRMNLAAALGEAGASWLSVSPEKITALPPGDAIVVELIFDASQGVTATGLPGEDEFQAGTYTGEVIVVSNDPDEPEVIVPVTFTVLPDDLSVSPRDGLVSSGFKRGPFTPSRIPYVLENIGGLPLSWTTSWQESWVTVSPSNGQLFLPGMTQVVEVAINANADGLSAGNYDDLVSFLNVTSGVTTRRQARLQVIDLPGEIDVTDTILPANDLDLDFGPVPVGDTRTELVTINNTDALDDLFITRISPSPNLNSLGTVASTLNVVENDDKRAFSTASNGSNVVAEDFSILLYTDDNIHSGTNSHLDQAMVALGLSYTPYFIGEYDEFEAALITGGPWDLVILANDNAVPQMALMAALNEYVLDGGMLIAHSWKVLDGHPLWSTLGVTFEFSDGTPPDPVYWWDENHALFNSPESVPELTMLNDVNFGIYGQHVTPARDGAAVAGYTETPSTNDAALIVANGGRTIFRGFMDAQNSADLDDDGKPDGMELWVNLVSHMAGMASFQLPGVPALPYKIPPLDSLSIEVTYSPKQVSTNSAKLTILSNDEDEPSLEVMLRGHGVVNDLNVSPREGLDSSGFEGGPIRLLSQEYALGNNSSGTFNWEIAHRENWVTVNPTAGFLAAGATTTVTIAINP